MGPYPSSSMRCSWASRVGPHSAHTWTTERLPILHPLQSSKEGRTTHLQRQIHTRCEWARQGIAKAGAARAEAEARHPVPHAPIPRKRQKARRVTRSKAPRKTTSGGMAASPRLRVPQPHNRLGLAQLSEPPPLLPTCLFLPLELFCLFLHNPLVSPKALCGAAPVS